VTKPHSSMGIIDTALKLGGEVQNIIPHRPVKFHRVCVSSFGDMRGCRKTLPPYISETARATPKFFCTIR
jgi:hypothetical protein